MSQCNHISWLSLIEEEAEPLLESEWQMTHVIAEMHKLLNQFSQLIFLIDEKIKNDALH